jgi:5-methylcytosine-specific restriction endonuclease McrA
MTATDVLLTNAAYQVTARIPWQVAVTEVVTGEADVIESHPTRVIHSAGGLEIPFPTIIRQRRYVHVLHDTTRRLPTWDAILRRDKRTCAYCGVKGAGTVDHVLPKSRGGGNDWLNLVAACGRCNNDKADRTPLEWGHKLLWNPHEPEEWGREQQRVWDALAAAA